ncbi:MAG: clan AA aspartic protease [Chloroflexota bacterium]|nr:clan AA aspartic protease [Chloroflexota bacterium]
MIEGVVNAAYEAVVPLHLLGAAGERQEVDAVVDTGFNRFLTLPPALLAELGSRLLGVTRVVLATGSEEALDVYGVTVVWDGQPREVDALMADTTPLIGMSLLDRYRLQVDVRQGGRVVIERLGDGT